ncbi:MAG: efflux RND transporter periplasmic adaptor subunit [Polyangia bacterium]
MPTSLIARALLALSCTALGCADHPRGGVPPVAPSRPAASAPAPAHAAARPAPGFLGVVEAPSTADLASQLDSRLLRVHVRAGDHVRRGDVIAELDALSARRELAMAEAALLAANADLARANLELAEAGERATRRAAQVDLPSGASVGTVSDEERAGAAYQQKLARVKVESARAAVLDKRARIDQLRQLAEEGAVRAPFDGIVAQRYVDPGGIVHKGAPIVRVIETARLRVCFAVPESAASRVTVGQKVRIDTAEQHLTGQVEKVAPEIDAAARMVFAEASIDDAPATSVRSGEVARVQLVAQEHASR